MIDYHQNTRTLKILGCVEKKRKEGGNKEERKERKNKDMNFVFKFGSVLVTFLLLL